MAYIKDKGYIIYECLDCHNHFILDEREVTYSEEESKYMTCPYHGKHKRIIIVQKYNDIERCMDHISYKREKGRIKQKR